MESFSWDFRYVSETQAWDRLYYRHQAQEDGAGKAWALRGRECMSSVRAAVERMGQGLRPPQGLGGGGLRHEGLLGSACGGLACDFAPH